MLIAAKEKTVRRVVTTHLPTKWGVLQTIGFERDILPGSGGRETAVAIILGNLADGSPLVRIHSECFTGEVLGSLRCDCNDQLDLAMRAIAGDGRGLVIYEHQEGRGIGLMAKLRAYALQDEGLDTVEANLALGFEDDARDFGLSVAILRELGLDRVRLLTNNPDKVRALIDGGIEAEQLSCEAVPNSHSLGYLRTKKEKMGHALTLETKEQIGPISPIRPISHIDQGFSFATIDEALRELRAGRMIVVVDDEDRENEGDLTMAAEMVTPEAINFMATHGRGLICVAMTDERLKELEIGSMVPANSALGGTAFTVSIDLNRQDITTGISAYDRAQTIKMAVNPNSHPEDFARPGHVFPLRARPGGVLERRGQTEAAVDLASLAGLQPAGVICEIINDDGTMARLPDLIEFCKKHDLLMITVADLARYRFDSDYEGSLAAYDGMFPVCNRISPTDLDRTFPANTPFINAELIG
ncbi:MAG: 3,4-dihydroxy 2-butanone 4-phosphate synthase / cyclohydrolase [Blastocatellia bacterium]|nr:3,4-dihydroxy 2-butanone 4-phosphate synthase / cyclohydrolase [Blastocatellia bacterium]